MKTEVSSFMVAALQLLNNIALVLSSYNSSSTSSLTGIDTFVPKVTHGAPPDNYVPINSIPGTKLFTGIYYNVSIDRFHSSWVTWTEKKADDLYYMKIDVFADPRSGVGYINQWYFAPAENEVGWYSLRNRQLPEYLASVSTSEKVDNGYHIILDKNLDPSDSNVLWKPVFQPGLHNNKVYKLMVKSMPEAAVTMTWSPLLNKKTYSYFIKVDPEANNRAKYAENMELYQDTLFRFKSIEQEFSSSKIGAN